MLSYVARETTASNIIALWLAKCDFSRPTAMAWRTNGENEAII
jgi:hypothetical protein